MEIDEAATVYSPEHLIFNIVARLHQMMPRVFLLHNNQPLRACCTLGGSHPEGLRGCTEVLWVVAMCKVLFRPHGSALLEKKNNTTINLGEAVVKWHQRLSDAMLKILNTTKV